MASHESAWQQVMNLPPELAVPEGGPGSWWVAHTKPRNEKALALDLRARNIHCYLPLRWRTTRSRNSGRSSRSIVPIFTGYLFLNAGEEERRVALATNRIANTLRVLDQRGLVGELRQIQRVISTQTDFEWEPALVEGDWVRVLAGPLLGLEGVVARRVRKARLALNVKMLSQSVLIEVDRDLLERIDGPSFESPPPK